MILMGSVFNLTVRHILLGNNRLFHKTPIEKLDQSFIFVFLAEPMHDFRNLHESINGGGNALLILLSLPVKQKFLDAFIGVAVLELVDESLTIFLRLLLLHYYNL